MKKLYACLALLTCFLNLQAQLQSAQVISQPPASQNEIFPMDFDGDGDLDIVTTNGGGIAGYTYYPYGYKANQFRISVNNGSGVFTEQPLITLPDTLIWNFGDADNDGLLDIVYASETQIYYRHNLGSFTFDTPELLYVAPGYMEDCTGIIEYTVYPFEIRRLSIGDTDNDGMNDLLFATKFSVCDAMEMSDIGTGLLVYRMAGNGSGWGAPENFFPSSTWYYDCADIRIGDVTADGLNDIIYIGSAGWEMNLWQITRFIASPGTPGTAVLPADFEMFITFECNDVIFQDMDPDPGMEEVLVFHYNEEMESISYIDVNYDDWDQNVYYQYEGFEVDPGNISSKRLEGIDLYNDGYGDFIAIDRFGQLKIFINDENIHPYYSFTLATGLWETNNIRSGDMNGDGMDDLLLMQQSFIHVMYGEEYIDPAEAIGEAVVISEPPASQKEMFPMDIDGDGDMDVVTTDGGFMVEEFIYFSQGFIASEFRLNMNDGAGNFTEQALFTLPGNMSWAFGDVDVDGLVDFMYSDGVHIYYMQQESPGSFGTASLVYQVPVPMDCPLIENDGVLQIASIKRIGLGDIDNDGDEDLLMATNDWVCQQGMPFVTDWQRIYTSRWNGSSFDPPIFFDEPMPQSGAVYCGYLDVIDINQDGRNDIVQQQGPDAALWEIMIWYATADPMVYDLFQVGAWDEIVFQEMDGLPGLEALGYLGFSTESYWDPVVWTVNGEWLPSFSFPQPYDNVSTARFDVVDLYNDGRGDAIVINELGTLHVFRNGDNAYPFTSFYTETGITNSYNIRSGEMNGDDAEDILIMDEGHIYLLPGQSSGIASTTMTIQVFFDENMDGNYDVGDAPIEYSQIGFDNGYVYTNESGQASFSIFPGEHTISAGIDSPFLGWSTPSTYTLTIEEGTNTALLFGVIPVGPSGDSLSCTLTSSVGICGTVISHGISVQNEGNTVLNGAITYELDPLYLYFGATPSPSLINGNMYTWEYENLAPQELFSIIMDVVSPSSGSIGQMVYNTASATAVDEDANVIASASDSNQHVIMCSYDPNDKQTDTGYTESNFILAGDEIDYTIRFQNTGNAAALNVRIEDQLSEKLDWSMMQPVAWSHEFDLVIDETGLAVFNFENINLPDSAADQAGSQGFVRYRIHSLNDLSAEETIENTAEIFFDLNAPVITNTIVHTIYDCEDLEQPIVSDIEVCAGDEITFSSNAQWIEELTWSFNGNEVGAGDYTHMLNESGVMTMNASNSLCTYSEEWNLVANSVQASFSVNGNVLSANSATSYQWLLNGNEIDNATSQQLEITQTGNYSVMVTDENGCSNTSTSQLVSYTDIEEWNSAEMIVSPNPAKDIIYVQIPGMVTGNICILDITGRCVMQVGINSEASFIDISSLASGTYFLRSDRNPSSIKLIITN